MTLPSFWNDFTEKEMSGCSKKTLPLSWNNTKVLSGNGQRIDGYICYATKQQNVQE